MPSSIGHALAGYAVTRLFGHRMRTGWVYVLAATAPDLDIIVSVLGDRPIDYAHRRSHSTGAALAAGAVLGGWSWMRGRRFLPHALYGTAAYASHLVLDYFGKEAQDGLPLLWPFSERRLSAKRPLFKTIYSRREQFFSGLATKRNLHRIAREVAILAPAVLAAAIVGPVTGSEARGNALSCPKPHLF